MRVGVRRAATGVAAAAIGLGAAFVAERYLVRRARSAPDPGLGEPLAERPGAAQTVVSFDSTALEVRVARPPAAGDGPRDGPTLVFAHGFSMDMTSWHYQWTALSRRYRCVLFDQRGHGGSAPAGDAGYTIDALGRDLRAVLDVTVPEGRAILLGHSLGGMAILSLAEHHPEEFGPRGRVAGVVLANTASGDIVKEALGELAVRATGGLRRALTTLGRRPGVAERMRRAAHGPGADVAFLVTLMTNFAPGAAPSVVEHVARVSSNTPAEIWPPFLQGLLDLDLRRAESRVTVPALVIVGERDRLTPPGGARALAAALPRASLVVIEGAGHLAMLERHERFTRSVEAFVVEATTAASDGKRRSGASARKAST